MGKSQQTFNKSEREKKRAKKKKEKQERKELRKQERETRGKLNLEDQLMYMDENGNLVDTKPDPAKKFTAKLEDIALGVPMNNRASMDTVQRGKVKNFFGEKGYGFITNKATKESIFVHINDAYPGISENHIVEYETGRGPKGAKAINVKRIIS